MTAAKSVVALDILDSLGLVSRDWYMQRVYSTYRALAGEGADLGRQLDVLSAPAQELTSEATEFRTSSGLVLADWLDRQLRAQTGQGIEKILRRQLYRGRQDEIMVEVGNVADGLIAVNLRNLLEGRSFVPLDRQVIELELQPCPQAPMDTGATPISVGRPREVVIGIVAYGHAQLENSGCGIGLSGGIGRLSTVLHELRTAYPDMVVVGLGLLRPQPHRLLWQTHLWESKLYLRLVRQAGVEVAAVPEGAYAIGADALHAISVPAGPLWICANLRHEGMTIGNSCITREVAGCRVGLIGVADQPLEGWDARLDRGIETFEFRNPVDAVRALLPGSLTPGRDLTVVFGPMSEGTIHTLATKVKGIDLIIPELAYYRGSFDEVGRYYRWSASVGAGRDAAIGYLGRALVVVPPATGATITVVRLPVGLTAGYPLPILEERALGSEVVQDSSVVSAVDSFYASVAGLLDMEVPGYSPGLAIPVEQSSPGVYTGAQVCAQCHTRQYDYWGSTPHARALNSLEEMGFQYSDNCRRCHVTGYGEPTGHNSLSDRNLRGVQCEECHGPGREHATTRKATAIIRVPAATVCMSCHDAQHSDFVYEERYRSVAHTTRRLDDLVERAARRPVELTR